MSDAAHAVLHVSHAASAVLQVLALGYSERFWRKYRFYFAYCEAAFDARSVIVTVMHY